MLSSFSNDLTADVQDASKGYSLVGSDIPGIVWVKRNLPHLCTAPFAPRMVQAWDWFEGIEDGVYEPAEIFIWPRGGAKSSTVEAGVTYVGSKLSRHFGLLVSETQDQADSHVQNIANMMDAVGARPRLNKVGRPEAWRRNQLRTENGFNLASFGIDAGQRGIRIDQYRPDFIVFDDVDNRHDTPNAIIKKIECITQSIMPTGSPDCIVVFAQNLIHANSIASQLVSERADFLLDRKIAVVEPAVIGLQTETIAREGRKPLYKIVAGTPTWEGQNLEVCEQQINTWGLETFLRESQHEVRSGSSFFDTLDELRHVKKSDYAPIEGYRPPKHWTYFAGMDDGYRDPFAFFLGAADETGKHHIIDYTQDSKLTNQLKLDRVLAMFARWGIDPRKCTIGYDETMQSRDSLDGITGESSIEIFIRSGLRVVPVSNKLDVQSDGFMLLREQFRIPGDPSPSIEFWEQYTTDLVYAVANATYDKLQTEKINHDECSHGSQAMRYGFATRPRAAKPNKADQTLAELQYEIDKGFAEQDLENRNKRLGFVKKRMPDGGFEWMPSKNTLRR